MDLIGFIFTSSHTVIVHQIPIHILQEIKNYGKSIKIYDTHLLRARSNITSTFLCADPSRLAAVPIG